MKLLTHTPTPAAVLALGLLLGGSFAAGADDAKTKAKPAAKLEKSSETEQTTTITGSHLKQKVKKSGTITDTASPVTVLDRAAIERTGASTVAGALSRGSTR